MKYQIHIGQDCSTLLLMRYTGLTNIPFVFDGMAFYSDDYAKVFSKDFLNQCDFNSVRLFLKTTPSKLIEMYNDAIETGFQSKKRRIDFHGFIGDKYNKVYIDVCHISNKSLFDLVDMSSLDAFIKSVEFKVKAHLESCIAKNVQDMKEAFEKHANDEIVFFGTIKHEMTQLEHDHFVEVSKHIAEMFPKSRVVAVSDVKSNADRFSDIHYLKFDHWYENDNDIKCFRKLLIDIGVLDGK